MEKEMESKILTYLDSIDPSTLGLTKPILAKKVVQLSSTGVSHLNYLLTMDGKRFIMRLSTRSRQQARHTAHEYRILKMLEKYDIAPKPYVLSRESMMGEPFTIIEYVEGSHTRRLTLAHVRELAALMARINAIKLSKSARKWVRKVDSVRNALRHPRKWLKDVKAYLKGDGRKEAFAAEAAKAYYKINDSAYGIRSRSRLLHLDVALENMLWDGRQLRLIDWERACLGDPCYELATLFDRMGMDKRQRNAFLKEYYRLTGYRSPEKMLFFSRVRAIDRLFWAVREAYRVKNGMKGKNLRKDLGWKELANIVRDKFEQLKQLGVIDPNAENLSVSDW